MRSVAKSRKLGNFACLKTDQWSPLSGVLGRVAYKQCTDTAHCYRWFVHMCVCVFLSVCPLIITASYRKRPNRSRCCLGYELGWAQETMYKVGKKQFLGDIPGPLRCTGSNSGERSYSVGGSSSHYCSKLLLSLLLLLFCCWGHKSKLQAKKLTV